MPYCNRMSSDAAVVADLPSLPTLSYSLWYTQQIFMTIRSFWQMKGLQNKPTCHRWMPGLEWSRLTIHLYWVYLLRYQYLLYYHRIYPYVGWGENCSAWNGFVFRCVTNRSWRWLMHRWYCFYTSFTHTCSHLCSVPSNWLHFFVWVSPAGNKPTTLGFVSAILYWLKPQDFGSGLFSFFTALERFRIYNVYFQLHSSASDRKIWKGARV